MKPSDKITELTNQIYANRVAEGITPFEAQCEAIVEFLDEQYKKNWENDFHELWDENRKKLSPMWAIRFIRNLLKNETL